MAIREVPLKKVVAPFQVRDPKSEALSDESIRQLAEEMKVNGVWDLAIPAREVDGKFEIACGSRRMAAYKLLKMDLVRLDVKARTDEEMRRIAAAENTAREPLSQNEMRRIVRELASMPIPEVAAVLGLGEPTVRHIRLAIEAIDQSGARVKDEVSSAAIADAKPLGIEAQKWVAENSTSFHGVAAAKKALAGVRQDQGNVIAEKIKEQLGTSVDVGAEAIARAAKKLKTQERSSKSKAAKRKSKTPPGLEKVLSEWTDTFIRFTNKIDTILGDKENLKYMKEFPFTAKEFRKAVANLRKRFELVEAELAKF